MGFSHCPICVVLAFVSVFMGVTRSYMLYILFKEFNKFNYFFQNQTYLGINNNIIFKMNISMSKNTESIDITYVCNIIIQETTPTCTHILLIN